MEPWPLQSGLLAEWKQKIKYPIIGLKHNSHDQTCTPLPDATNSLPIVDPLPVIVIAICIFTFA